jgi:pyruvate dehydrogenase E1 component alpha subunit
MSSWPQMPVPPRRGSSAADDDDRCTPLLPQMLRIRRFEERCVELYSAGKIRGFLHLYIGEEAVATGAHAGPASRGRHRGDLPRARPRPGARVSARPIMAEMYGKVEGCSRGRGGSMHLFDKETRLLRRQRHRRRRPAARGRTGAGRDAMQGRAARHGLLLRRGRRRRGRVPRVHEPRALWKLPVLFCCENNLYAMGRPWHHARSPRRTSPSRPPLRDGPARQVDGMDRLAVDRRRPTGDRHGPRRRGPVFLELRTYRFRAHSMYDAERLSRQGRGGALAGPRPHHAVRRAYARPGLLDDARTSCDGGGG